MTRTAIDDDRRRDDRLLARLAEGEGVFEDATRRRLRIVGPNCVRRLAVDPERLAALLAAGLLAEIAAGADAAPRLVVTALGRARLARTTVAGLDFRRQHGLVEDRRADDGTTLRIDAAESPLARLARARGPGRAWLTPARLAAGERLRSDFTLAQMMPTVTSNWSAAAGAARAAGARGGIADLTDRAVAARLRVEGALAAVGSGLDGVLVDVCCFLKGLETVESDRRWPQRSAKVVLDIALGRLADHYGLADEARGRDRVAPRAWALPDGRPGAVAPG